MKPSKTGFAHLMAATGYSAKGIKAALRHEAAFRQECVLAVLLIPLALVLPLAGVWQVLMIASLLLVMIVELLNSAIEAVVDLVSPDAHELAGRAKDMGSAAVMGALLLAGMVWLVAIAQLLMP